MKSDEARAKLEVKDFKSAELYYNLGDFPRCRENLIQILRIDPTDAKVTQALSEINARIQK